MVELVQNEEDLIVEDIVTADLFDETESDNPIFAVEDALDAYGRVCREADGTLAFDDFLAVKEII